MPTTLPIDTSDKIAVNGCDLLNRYELSSYQNRELQRYIDQNAHILSFKDREKPAPPKIREKPKSNYNEISRNMSSGESPQTGYTKLDSYFPTKRNTNDSEQLSVGRQLEDPTCLTTPSGQKINLTSDFPMLGDGSNLDDGFAVQYKPVNYGSTPGSGYQTGYPTEYGSRPTQTTQNGYDTLDSGVGSGTSGKGGLAKSISNVPSSPYGSLKRIVVISNNKTIISLLVLGIEIKIFMN